MIIHLCMSFSHRLPIRWICSSRSLYKPGDRNLKARPLIFYFAFGCIIFSIWNKVPIKMSRLQKTKSYFSECFTDIRWPPIIRKKSFDLDKAHLPLFLWGCCMVFPQCTSPIQLCFTPIFPQKRVPENARDFTDLPPACWNGKTRSAHWQLVGKLHEQRDTTDYTLKRIYTLN